jgi:regulatory protein
MDRTEEFRTSLARFCAYRERCSKEVKEKLVKMGATQTQIAALIKWLKDENYLDDARFAQAFARGKFRVNFWGKYKIINELQQRDITSEHIKTALEEIPMEEYQSVLEKLLLKRWKETNKSDIYLKQQKTIAYLAGKGYETDLIWKIVRKIEKQNS